MFRRRLLRSWLKAELITLILGFTLLLVTNKFYHCLSFSFTAIILCKSHAFSLLVSLAKCNVTLRIVFSLILLLPSLSGIKTI